MLAMGGTLALTSVLTFGSSPLVPGASAEEAEVEPGFLFESPGAFSSVVPDGVCAAVITAQGGAGGNALGGDDVGPDDDPPEEPADPIDALDLGRGAQLTATYSVVPGQPFSGFVGGGGAGARIGGTNGANVDGATGNGDGGNGGDGGHPGAGGGALTTVTVAGIELMVAGGGGGGGGGHNAEFGAGGNAGVPESPGEIAAGHDGAPGWDAAGDGPYEPGGGEAGGTEAPGAGGVHPANEGLNGFPGEQRDGGKGGPDPSFDTGGGGGGGYFGAGGGASTITAGVPNGGAGGGGGSSYVHPTSPTGDAAPARDYEGLLGPAADPTRISAGPDGLVAITWLPCQYNLDINKTVTKVKWGKKGGPGRDNTVRIGDRVDWRVTITNRGPDVMTRGDLIDLVDSRATDSRLRIMRIRSFGGTKHTSLSNPDLTCNAEEGKRLPETLLCSRNYRVRPDLLGGSPQPTGARGLNPGESLRVVFREKVTDAGRARNVATVSNGDGEPVSDNAGIRVREGRQSLDLEKTASTDRITHVGQRIRYEFRVTNTGNVVLSDIHIRERKFTGSGELRTPRCPTTPQVLRPGRSVICVTNYRVTRQDLRAGQIVNRAVARGVAPDGSGVRSDPDRAVVRAPLPAPPTTGYRVAV